MEFPNSNYVENSAFSLIEKALNRGAKGADILFYSGKSSSLSLRDGKPEQNRTGFFMGIGLRVIDADGRQGVAHMNVLDPASFENLVSWSWANCCSSEPDPWVTLYEQKPSYRDDLKLEDEAVSSITPEQRQESCLYMSQEASSKDKRILSIRSASWYDSIGKSFYMSSTGIRGWYNGTSVSAGLSLVMSDGVNLEMGGYGESCRFLSDLPLSRIVEEAVTQTAYILGGKPLKTGKYTLILSPEVSASFLSVIGELFLASNVHKNMSLYKGKLGKQEASSLLTITDDGLMPKKLGTAPFDGEGVPCQRTVLMEKGVIKNFLYNLKYGLKDGVPSTGNGARSFSSVPDVDVSNIYIEPGTLSQEDIFCSVRNGIYIMDLLGLHTVNPVSGDFSLGIKGVALHNGELSFPVSGMTIAGNLLDFLKKIVCIGNDLLFWGDTGGCTVVVEDVTAAGL
ncbi:TldD/PmbA family protein [Aminobacterium mobile]|uniref:TldD/PmbA family protein n=1 Tax=Aminobacterium mobile TaxID=81467 RepID=UPI0004B0DB34|nr:TldD/PmbA family protein [Aminobacterium mobile]